MPEGQRGGKGVLLLVGIDLANADVALFEVYEARVLPLLETHGASLLERLRAADGRSETHLIDFPDAESLAAYRADAVRVAASPLWESCRASAVSKEVARLK